MKHFAKPVEPDQWILYIIQTELYLEMNENTFVWIKVVFVFLFFWLFFAYGTSNTVLSLNIRIPLYLFDAYP